MNVRHEPITVNVNDWIKERESGRGWAPTARQYIPVVADTEVSQPSAEELREMQRKWAERARIKELEDKLEEHTIDCPECETIGRPYKDDYVCHRCRDIMGG